MCQNDSTSAVYSVKTGFVSVGETLGINGILFISILKGLCTYVTLPYTETLHSLTERIKKKKKHSEELSISTYVNSLSKPNKTNSPLAPISHTTTKLHTVWERLLKRSSD